MIEASAIVNDQRRRVQVAQDPGRGADLNPLGGAELSISFPHYHYRCGPKPASYDGGLTDNHCIMGVDFAVHFAVDSDRALEKQLATYFTSLSR